MSYSVRFRHTSGDVGPFSFQESSPISLVRERLFQEWPTEGPLSKEPPASVQHLRLICGGRFLEDAEKLSAIQPVVGPPSPNLLVTIHTIVRQGELKPPRKEPSESRRESSSCCVVS